MKHKKTWQDYLFNLVVACGILYYVLRLSEPGRTAIDWAVIALVAGAILWNVVQAGRHLFLIKPSEG